MGMDQLSGGAVGLSILGSNTAFALWWLSDVIAILDTAPRFMLRM